MTVVAARTAAVLFGAALFGQQTPRGADISGVWNYATLTPLERPGRFASKPFLIKEEAAAFEKKFCGLLVINGLGPVLMSTTFF
jgi:hypothetical protein